MPGPTDAPLSLPSQLALFGNRAARETGRILVRRGVRDCGLTFAYAAAMTDKPNKLFHVLVVVGASMTGGACGGQTSALPVDQDAARDAAADAHDAGVVYVGISPPPCAPGQPGHPCDAGSDAYGQIGPFDAGTDAYVQIMPNLDGGHDAYNPISPPPVDAGDVDVYTGIAPAIDASYPPIG